MASFWAEEKYPIHFFCALCGGPFARVFRTDEPYASSRKSRRAGHRRVESDRHRHRKVSSDEFSPTKRGDLFDSLHGLPDSKTGYTPPIEQFDSLAVKSIGVKTVGAQSVSLQVRPAYNGTDLRDEETKWTRVLRALIHKDAQVQPEGGRNHLDDEDQVYLTGRGRVREDASRADAYPSIQDDLDTGHEDEHGNPIFDNDTCRFHLYQEPDRNDRKFHIGSIPFHEECWDIFLHAARHGRTMRNLSDTPAIETTNLDMVWSSLCNLLPIAVDGKLSDLTIDALCTDTIRDPINRLSMGCMGNGGYLEAQACGEGKKWLHADGLHWLVANPQRTGLSSNPFRYPVRDHSIGRKNQSNATYLGRHTKDPFWQLPREVLVETLKYLTCKETFRWRTVSVPLNTIVIPQKYYQRYLKHEMAFLPTLYRQMIEFESSGNNLHIDWRSIFEHAFGEWRSTSGLRNRRRIWNIVQPIAEELVETCAQNLRMIGGLDKALSSAITIARGSVGVLSGAEGQRETTLFTVGPLPRLHSEDGNSTDSADPTSTPDSESSRPGLCLQSLQEIYFWLDHHDQHLRGMEFVFTVHPTTAFGSDYMVRKRFGTRTAIRKTLSVDKMSMILTGFNVCWYNGCVRGIQCVYEDPTQRPNEYCDAEILSQRFGTWDGPMRRLVAPRTYRLLAGITGFVSSSGQIETFALLEQKLSFHIDNGQHLMTPPDSVPLSHQESSLWKRVPPNDVELYDRQGPTSDDWRTREADWEIFEKTSLYEPPGQLKEISVYVNDDYVTGLHFEYTRANRSVSRRLGVCHGAVSTIEFARRDELTVVIISHGATGVHCLQLITSNAVGPAGGERYLGTQTVYAQDPVIPRGKERLGHLSYLKASIIGFHCLFSPDGQRLVQIGLIARPETMRIDTPSSTNSRIGSPGHSFPMGLGTSIPMVDTDELKNPWVDGAPPNTFIRGRKNSECLKSTSFPFDATFAGWIDLRPGISRVIIYGRMEGIKFIHGKDMYPDVSFGNTRSSSQVSDQSIGSKKRITRISRSRSDATDAVEEHLPTVRFMALDDNASDLEVEVDSEFLVGLQFSFSADRIIDWQPLFDFSASKRRRKNVSSKALHLRDHWKTPSIVADRPFAQTDADLLGKYCVLADFFYDANEHTKVDGVKGYVVHGKFCGLRFRRNGLWDETPLGQASSYETIFLLQPGEHFVSIFVSENGDGSGDALALCTDLGRSTPWIGNSSSDTSSLKAAPPGRKAVGIYMAFSSPNCCDKMGIIHDESNEYPAHHLMTKAAPLPSCEISKRDTETDLDWTTDPKGLPTGYELSHDISYSVFKPPPQRAFALFDPTSLQKIDSYVNPVSGRYGLKALRFHADRRMGTTTLGDWQDQYARPTEDQSMRISGSDGERITSIKLSLYDTHDSGKRIIGLTIKTNWRRKRNIANWAAFTHEEPPADVVYKKELKCKEHGEIVGFHYLIGLYIHDIGLITRKIQE